MSDKPWSVRGGVTLSTKGEAQKWARSVVQSLDYRESVRKRAADGDLPPAVECLLLHYAYGKPTEQVQMNVQVGAAEDLSEMSAEQLSQRLNELQSQLQEAQEIEEALPAEFKVA